MNELYEIIIRLNEWTKKYNLNSWLVQNMTFKSRIWNLLPILWMYKNFAFSPKTQWFVRRINKNGS